MTRGATTRWRRAGARRRGAARGLRRGRAGARRRPARSRRPADTRLLNLRAGDCVSNLRERLEHPDGGHNGVPKITAVNCSAAHDAEVLLVQKLDEAGEKWPGYAIVNGEGGARAPAAAAAAARASSRPTGRSRSSRSARRDDRWDYEDQYSIYYLALYPKPQTGPRRSRPAPRPPSSSGAACTPARRARSRAGRRRGARASRARASGTADVAARRRISSRSAS